MSCRPACECVYKGVWVCVCVWVYINHQYSTWKTCVSCTCVHVHTCIAKQHTQSCAHVHAQTHRHTDTQTHQHTDTPRHQHTYIDIQTHRRTHRHTNTHTHRHTDTQKHRHVDTLTHRHTDTDTDTHKDKRHVTYYMKSELIEESCSPFSPEFFFFALQILLGSRNTVSFGAKRIWTCIYSVQFKILKKQQLQMYTQYLIASFLLRIFAFVVRFSLVILISLIQSHHAVTIWFSHIMQSHKSDSVTSCSRGTYICLIHSIHTCLGIPICLLQSHHPVTASIFSHIIRIELQSVHMIHIELRHANSVNK